EQARLSLAHPSLPSRVGFHVGPIVVKKIALNVGLPRLPEKSELVGPQVGIITVHVRVVSDVTRTGGSEREQVFSQAALLRGAILPELASRIPVLAQPFVVRDRVLDDERFDTLGVSKRHAEAYRSAVVLHVERIAGETESLGEMLRDGRDRVERVRERLRI